MSPSQALDEQRTLHDYLASTFYADYATGVLRGEKAVGGTSVVDGKGNPDGAAWAKTERHTLGMAETFYVEPDMVTLSEAAARSLDGTDQFRHDLWPAEVGFVWLARPWYITDVRGQRMGIRALSWHRRSDPRTGRPGMFISEYGDYDDPHCEVTARTRAIDVNDKMRSRMGRLHLSGLAWIGDGRRVGPEEHRLTDEEATAYAEAHRAGSGGDELPVVAQSTNPARLYLALIMLMGQTVARVARVDADRPIARRAKRIGLPGRVTVITLRRAAEDGTEYTGPRSVEWSRRWIVRGKWQWRRCGETHPLAQPYEGGWRCRVYVGDYVKGPADKPLVVPDRVYALRR